MIYNPDFIAHHGIKNQKWGVRHGPPYPLDYKTKRDANIGTKYGRARWKDEMFSEKSNVNQQSYNNRLYDMARDTIASNKFAPVNVYSGRHIDDMKRMHSVIISDMGNVSTDAQGNKNYGFKYESSTKYISEHLNEFKKEPESMSKVFNSKSINPSYGLRGTTNNCPMATTAAALNAMGYNVSAAHSESGAQDDSFSYWFDGAKKTNGNLTKIHKELMSYPDGAFGSFSGAWPKTGGGHVMNWAKENGKIKIYDNQTGKSYNGLADMQKMFQQDGGEKMGYANRFGENSNGQRYELRRINGRDVSTRVVTNAYRGMDRGYQGFITYRLDNAKPNWEHLAEDNVVTSNLGAGKVNFTMNKTNNTHAFTYTQKAWNYLYDDYKERKRQ